MKHIPLKLNYFMIASLAGMAPCVSDAAVRRPNRSDAYIQINAMAQSTAYADQYYENLIPQTEDNLPVRVANKEMAEMIAGGGTYKNIGAADLDRCSRIYPNGDFAWATPTAGMGRGGSQTCVAVVELRSTEPVKGGTEKNPVLARAYVAAGDSMNCNISDFPEDSYTIDAGNVLFPADAEPTRADVIKVLNEEQKQNAAIKIAATTIIGAVGGNAVGKNEIGEDGLFGTGKKKMQSAAIGGLVGAAVGVGNTYGGKVAGDVILSTSVNAAAGSIIGNMVATGDDVLRIEDCTLEDGTRDKCLWGRLVTKKPVNLSDASASDYKSAFYNFKEMYTVVCDGNPTNGEYKNCDKIDLISVVLNICPGKTIDQISKDDECFKKIESDTEAKFQLVKSTTGGRDSIVNGVGDWVGIASGGTADKQAPAMIVGVHDKMFGIKKSDWARMKSQYSTASMRRRNGRGVAEPLMEGDDIADFYPMYVSASDGGIIDFSNKARMKGTLIGAGVGGAMGAFVGYQGAQNDIENRWVTAVREYKDSLQKIYCATGTRFLTFYNETVGIPDMP